MLDLPILLWGLAHCIFKVEAKTFFLGCSLKGDILPRAVTSDLLDYNLLSVMKVLNQ